MPDVPEPSCPCRVVEPYGDTTDLQDRVARLDRSPGHAIFEVVSEWEIRCRQCGARWEGQPCPGWIYGDTVWRREPRPSTAPAPPERKTPRRAGRRRSDGR